MQSKFYWKIGVFSLIISLLVFGGMYKTISTAMATTINTPQVSTFKVRDEDGAVSNIVTWRNENGVFCTIASKSNNNSAPSLSCVKL